MAPRKGAEIFLPGYKATLRDTDLLRYNQLLQMIEGVDPFELQWLQCTDDIEALPSMNLLHIQHYLVYGVKAHTNAQMLAYKATNAFKLMQDGWVQDIRCHVLGPSKVLVLGKVKHTQSLNDPPARAWVLAKQDGDILAGWCSCVAGSGEACSHVGAVLYAVEFGVGKRDARSCTSKQCSWLPPALRDVPYLPISQYDLTSPEAKRKKVVQALETGEDPEAAVGPATLPNKPLTERQRSMLLTPQMVEDFIGNMKVTDPNSALVRLSQDHSQEVPIPAERVNNLPPSFQSFFDPQYTTISFNDLLEECERKLAGIEITEEQSVAIRNSTIGQHKNKKWHSQRAGKLGGSVVYDIIHTNIEDPSLTLIKKVCYPEAMNISTPAMRYGQDKEAEARTAYSIHMKQCNHTNFRVKEIGFIVLPDYPYLGASPDGLVRCDCCGKGLVEIKTRQRLTNEVENSHMWQMQLYMFVIATLSQLHNVYCDYVIYRENAPLHIERILPDKIIQSQIVNEGKVRFIKLILPELLGKYYSSLKHIVGPLGLQRVVCYCQQPAKHPLARCASRNCTFTFFHLQCVGLTRARKWGKWLCPDCNQRANN